MSRAAVIIRARSPLLPEGAAPIGIRFWDARPQANGPVEEISHMMLLRYAAEPRRSLLPTLSPSATGRLLMVVAFSASGIGTVVAKSAYRMGAVPVSFLVVRLVVAVLFLAVLCGPALWRLEPTRILKLILIGLGFGVQTLAYYSAVDLAPVGLVVVTVSSYPIVVIAMDAVASRSLPKPSRMAAMAVSLAGLWLGAGSPTGGLDVGIILALISSVGYAVYLRLSAQALTPRYPDGPLAVRPMVATAWVMAGALVFMTAVALVTSPPVPAGGSTGIAMLHGVMATAVPIVAIYAALQRLGAGQVAVLGPLEPIVATGAAVLMLGESLTLLQGLGVTMVIVAVAQLSGVRPRAVLPRLPFTVPGRPGVEPATDDVAQVGDPVRV